MCISSNSQGKWTQRETSEYSRALEAILCGRLSRILHYYPSSIVTQPWFCGTAEDLWFSYLLVRAAHVSVPVSSNSMSSQDPGACVVLNVHPKKSWTSQKFPDSLALLFSLFTLISLSIVKTHMIWLHTSCIFFFIIVQLSLSFFPSPSSQSP